MATYVSCKCCGAANRALAKSCARCLEPLPLPPLTYTDEEGDLGRVVREGIDRIEGLKALGTDGYITYFPDRGAWYVLRLRRCVTEAEAKARVEAEQA